MQSRANAPPDNGESVSVTALGHVLLPEYQTDSYEVKPKKEKSNRYLLPLGRFSCLECDILASSLMWRMEVERRGEKFAEGKLERQFLPPKNLYT